MSLDDKKISLQEDLRYDFDQSKSSENVNTKDMIGVALLRQIFPELSSSELEMLHANHMKAVRELSPSQEGHSNKMYQPSSTLGKRIWKETKQIQQSLETEEEDDESTLTWRPVELPDDFLRLPSTVAVRRYNDKCQKWYYLTLKRLEERVIEQHEARKNFKNAFSIKNCITKVVFSDSINGLGMTLCEEGGRIWIYSIQGRDGSRWLSNPPLTERGGPAMEAGVLPGDWLLGINGQALLPSKTGNETLLQNAVSAIKFSADPIVLHFHHIPSDNTLATPEKKRNTPTKKRNEKYVTVNNFLPTTTVSQTSKVVLGENQPPLTPTSTAKSRTHPFVKKLAERGLLKNLDDQIRCSEQLKQFTERTRQWESFGSFRLDTISNNIRSHFNTRDLPPSFNIDDPPSVTDQESILTSYAASTPTLDPEIDYIPEKYFLNDEDHSLKESFLHASQGSNDSTDGLSFDMSLEKQAHIFSASRSRNSGFNLPSSSPPLRDEIFIPLMGVRKALCVRIVHNFFEENRIAYTIWVFDVESGREWYAPVRYLRDFQDLRAAALPLCPSLSQLPFPQKGWNVFGNAERKESEALREVKRRQLEIFLRKLSGLLYTHDLNPLISEVAFHLQSFLGCDVSDTSLRLHSEITLSDAIVWQMSEIGHNEVQMKVRLLLKRSIQRYVFRLFLLEELQQLVDEFVDATRRHMPKLRELESIEAQGRNKLKEKAMLDLERIKAFLDQIQNLVLEGCRYDLLSISQRRNFFVLHPFMEGVKGEGYLDRILREGVREQIEIEIYVPLRSVISRLLVNGWRHDDLEIYFKMNELRKRPQSEFRIPSKMISPTSWSSVSSVLNEGVGMSTLPCAKLRAIVDSAKEISRVFTEENRGTELGADDFLPIFIYCVVQAEMERPCALCVLLRTLCEETSSIGETGYYLASFEAAITHIQEINLAER